MKKTFILLVFFSFILTNTYAQDERVSFGVRAGLNIASVTGRAKSSSINIGGVKESLKHSPRIGFHGGVYSEIKIAEAVSIQPELLFTMKGYSEETDVTDNGVQTKTDYKLALNYAELPIQVRVNIKGLFLFGGPSFGFLVTASEKSKTTTITGSSTVTSESTNEDKDDFKSMDIGMYLGIGYQLENGLNFAFRYCRAFNSIYQTTYNNSNAVVQFSLAYRIKSSF